MSDMDDENLMVGFSFILDRGAIYFRLD